MSSHQKERYSGGLAHHFCAQSEILKLCEQYAHDAKERALDYKQVFLETGGTEEEWKEHDISISVDYEIKNETNDYLSFVIYGYESW